MTRAIRKAYEELQKQYEGRTVVNGVTQDQAAALQGNSGTPSDSNRYLTELDGASYVVGPASAVDSNLVEFDTTTGKLVKDSLLTHADAASAISLKHTQGTDTTLGTQAENLDMGNFNIVNLANAVDIHNAVTLEDVLNSVGVVLNFWCQASNVLGEVYAQSVAYDSELITTTPQTLSSIYFLSAVADTPTPFEIKDGSEILTHFQAKVASVTGTKPVTLHTELYYVDADGTSNPVQIGADSDETAVLSETKTLYENHIVVTTEINIPAGKRLRLQFVATTTGATNNPTVWVYHGDVHNHLSIPVSGSVLGRFLLKAGGTMSGAIAMGSNKVTGLAAPTTDGDAIRATTKITEALLESATDLKHTQGTDTGTSNPTFAIGSLKFYGLSTQLADTATVVLTTATANYPAHGFVQVSTTGVVAESAEFEMGSDGNVNIIRGTANVVANANTTAKFCLGTAASQNPLTIKNYLGATVQAIIEFRCR